MQGLLGQAQQDEAQEPIPENQEVVPEGQEASPELQQQFEKYVRNGMRLIHSPETRDEIVKLVSTDKPALGVAMALSTIAQHLNESMKQQGVTIDPKAKMAGMQELMGQVIEIAQSVTDEQFDGEKVKHIASIVEQEGGIQ